MTSRSVWHSPAARIRTSTSVGLSGPAVTVSTVNGVRGARSTAARNLRVTMTLADWCFLSARWGEREGPIAERWEGEVGVLERLWNPPPHPGLLRPGAEKEFSTYLRTSQRRLHRPLALDRHPVHDAALAVIVVDRVVLDAAIVPERDRALFPAEAAGEFGPHRVLPQVVEQRRALLLGHVLEADREGAVDVERFATGLDMSADDRMLDLAVRVLAIVEPHRLVAGIVTTHRVEPIGPARAVYRRHVAEHRLHAVRQRVIGEVLAGKHRIAANRRHLASIEHRAQGRSLEIADIGVPAAAEIARLVFLLTDFEDLLVVGHTLDEFMDLQLAEAAAEGEVLVGGQVLVAEEDHLVVGERVADFADRRVIELLRQVDAGDLGAERPRNPVHRNRAVGHGTLAIAIAALAVASHVDGRYASRIDAARAEARRRKWRGHLSGAMAKRATTSKRSGSSIASSNSASATCRRPWRRWFRNPM